MADFQAFNSVYARFFPEPYPARSTVAVKGMAGQFVVEIEAIAVRPSGS
jgi:2-iminobutanoate/2-iminopropanoate deaminase